MTKRLKEEFEKIEQQSRELRFSLGAVILTLLCSFLIVVATFTRFEFWHYMLNFGALFSGHLDKFVYIKNYAYIPQIPALILIAVLLGRRYGVISILLYIIAGLSFFPVFALGGGIKYVAQYNFGYILAYIPALCVASYILKKDYTLKSMAKASILAVLTIHITGILYSVLIAVVKHESLGYVSNLIFVQSGPKIIYDFIFCFCVALIAKPIKRIIYYAIG